MECYYLIVKPLPANFTFHTPHWTEYYISMHERGTVIQTLRSRYRILRGAEIITTSGIAGNTCFRGCKKGHSNKTNA